MSAKTILLTGATRGLGRAMVAEFARLGHVVAGCGRRQPELNALSTSFPSPHSFRRVNVAAEPEVEAWANKVLANHGTPDLVLNNAAIINENAPLWEVSAREFDAVLDVNVKGVANVIRHFLPAMIQRGRGVVVNFSSGWGRSTDAEVAPYCATKWAIEGLTQSLAQELPSGLAAIPLNPGIINTEMLQQCFGGSAERFPDPSEWARVAVPFLLKLGRKDNGKQLTVRICSSHD